MRLSHQLAKHFKEVFFGGNWTVVNLNDTLSDVSWKQATTNVNDLNSIAVLTYHIGYFVSAILPVLQGAALDAHDKFSFDCPPIQSEEDWNHLKTKILNEAQQCVLLIEQLPANKIAANFTDEKYGTYYRNIHGLIEHTHYHLGQISLIKKIIPPV